MQSYKNFPETKKPLYLQFLDAGYSEETICSHCQGEMQIHGYTNLACPENGEDFPLAKILKGERSTPPGTFFSNSLKIAS